MSNSVITVKEVVICAFIFLLAGCFMPLLFYPVNTWTAYYTHESPLKFLQINTGYFVICEFWGFAFYLGLKAVTTKW